VKSRLDSLLWSCFMCALAALIPLVSSVGCADDAKSGTPLLARPADFREIIERAKEKVFPALVYIKPIKEEYLSGEKRKKQIFGSGVIISPDGLIVTNSHVVEKAIKIDCVLYSKEQFEADIVGLDPETDLALLRLRLPDGHAALPYGEFADSDEVTEGEFVMAMGSPFGFARSISIGVISNTRRYLGFEGRYLYNTWLQTDAAINVGNSGGPLVNTEGKIVGINTLTVFMAENVGFAIPSNLVKEIVERLRKHGRIARSWTGMRLQALRDFQTNTFVNSERGVLVAGVEEGSPAEKAGVRTGDILIAVNGSELNAPYVEDLPAARRRLADLPAGKPAEFRLARGKEELVVTIRPGRKGKVKGEDFDCKRWNMTVKEINKFEDPDIYHYRKAGVFINGIKYPGNASDSGLKRGDIILKVDGQAVDSLARMREIYQRTVEDEGREKSVLLEILRGGYRMWVVLDYTKEYEEGG